MKTTHFDRAKHGMITKLYNQDYSQNQIDEALKDAYRLAYSAVRDFQEANNLSADLLLRKLKVGENEKLCRQCGDPHNPEEVKRSLGKDSVPYLQGYCSAFCYTEALVK